MNNMSKQRLAIMIAGAVGIIAIFLPWASVAGFSGNGMDGGDGWITLAGFAAAIGLCFVGDQSEVVDAKFKWGIVAAGAACAVVGLINLISVLSEPAVFGVSLSPGIGLFLTLIAGVAVAALGFKGDEWLK